MPIPIGPSNRKPPRFDFTRHELAVVCALMCGLLVGAGVLSEVVPPVVPPCGVAKGR